MLVEEATLQMKNGTPACLLFFSVQARFKVGESREENYVKSTNSEALLFKEKVNGSISIQSNSCCNVIDFTCCCVVCACTLLLLWRSCFLCCFYNIVLQSLSFIGAPLVFSLSPSLSLCVYTFLTNFPQVLSLDFIAKL